jgi:hypothetical protein
MMNAVLLSSGMPNNMWGEAILFACYILNRVRHKKLDKTPYEFNLQQNTVFFFLELNRHHNKNLN